MPDRSEQGASSPPREAPRTLVLLRHGETDWNAEHRAQGHTDIGLNRLGWAQAGAVAPALAALRPSRLWSSDLARALQTAAPVAAATGLEVEPDARLREYDVGERAGLTSAEFAVRFHEEYAAWVVGEGSPRVPGEESTEQVRARVVPALRDCLGALSPGQTGVVVLHGACLKVGLLGLLDWPWALARSLRGMDNGGFCVIAEHPLRGGLRLTSYNQQVAGAGLGPDFATDGAVG